MLVINTANQQVMGVQVMADGRNADAYDQDRVVVVSGASDLYDSLAIPRQRGSGVESAAMPGMLAAHFLLKLKRGSAADKFFHQAYTPMLMPTLKLFARQHFGNVSCKVDEATENLEKRILHHIGL